MCPDECECRCEMMMIVRVNDNDIVVINEGGRYTEGWQWVR